MVRGLSQGFHAVQLYDSGSCASAGSSGAHAISGEHPGHKMDLPPILVGQDGIGRMRVAVPAVATDGLFDSDGTAVAVHALPDNLAQVPARYTSGTAAQPGPDEQTRLTGDPGAVELCGVVERPASPSPSPAWPPGRSPTPTPVATPCMGVAMVTLAVSHATITAGNAPMLSGTAIKNQGAWPDCHPSGTEVTIYEQRYGESVLRQVATMQSRSDGTFELPVRPLVQTTYLASAYGSSAKASVRVHRRMDFTSTGPTFAGRLTPAEAPIPVGLAYIDATGRYRYLGQTVSDVAGNFSITARLPRGTFTYVVYTSPRQGLLRGTRSIRFTS